MILIFYIYKFIAQFIQNTYIDGGTIEVICVELLAQTRPIT